MSVPEPASAPLTLVESDELRGANHVTLELRVHLFARAVPCTKRRDVERMKCETVPVRRIAVRGTRSAIAAPPEAVASRGAGRAALSDLHVPIETLACIASMDDGKITFANC